MATPITSLSDREIRSRLAAVAREAVRSPAIDAVVLFGSRARGDSHPDSDWDVALIANSDLGHPDMVAARKRIERLDRHAAFEVWERTTQYLRENGDKSNLTAGAVVTQGVALAGEWPLARAEKDGRLVMNLDIMRVQQAGVCEFIASGWLAAGMQYGESDPDTRRVSYLSGLAAELLAKDIVASHYVQPVRSHDFFGLADQLEHLPLQEWESVEQRREEIDALREMNGITVKLHLGIYSDHPEEKESLEKGIRRLLLTMKLQARWLSRCADRGPEWNQAAQDAGRKMLKTAATLRSMPTDSHHGLLEILPNEVVQSIIEWEANAHGLCGDPVWSGRRPR